MSSAMATPPGSSAGTQNENHSAGRPMRLKVAYTFDDESKSNCLARYPHLVHSRAIQVDKDLLVGAVEFKTCILSMISSSPELVAKMSQDYSIYAYDYSELGVPLVGCGLLSWAMTTVNNSNHGSENPAPARHIITGRISSNNFGFFSNDEVKETLEVKFKLTPVQTFTQAQFVQSVHTYNALAKAIPGGFDASAWTNYLNQHPNILAPPTHRSNAPILLPVPSRALDEPLLIETESDINHKSRPQPKRDGNGLYTSSEKDGEPPKKKARTNTGRARKTNGGSRKKASAALPPAPLSPIPELFPSPVPQFKEPLNVQPSPPTPSPPENTIGLLGAPSGVSFNSQDMAFSLDDDSPAPPTVNSTLMASSPPTGNDDSTEEPRAEFSPEPTSPVLPSLPPNEGAPSQSREYAHDLECLFEDVKSEAINNKSTPIELSVAVTSQFEQEKSRLKPPALSELNTMPDDMTMSAAPSPNPSHELTQPKPKPKRKYPRKSKSTMSAMPAIPSEPVASSDIGEEGRKIKRSKSEKAARTAANVKERIHAQMLAAINEGKMPNYCMNCGAIETPTWRKVSMKDDNDGGEGEGDGKGKREKEVLLCNPCGLWHGSHKTMRPQDYWDGKKEEPAPKKSRSKKKKPVSAPTVPNQTSRQTSEPCTEPIIVPDEDEEQGLPMMLPPSAVSEKRLAMTPKGDRSAKGSDPEWEAASAASKRAFQSSPAKRGSAASPIDLENLESGSQSPRRLLFATKPIPNRSPIRKPTDSVTEARQSNLVAVAGKENRAPEGINTHTTVGKEIQRPTTPTKKRVNHLHPRTPLSSPVKSGKLISPSPWNADIFASGGKRRANGGGISATPERRAGQTLVQRCNLSPTSELLEKIMSMADMPADLAGNSPDHLPGLSPIDSNRDFGFGEDIFGTDMAMPSSPPPLFNLGDATEDEVNGWGEFLPSTPEFNSMDYGLDIFEDMTGVRGAAETEPEAGSVKSEKCSSEVATPGAIALTVDFSSYIDEATKNFVGGS